MKSKLFTEINKQVSIELESAHIYLQMSAWFEAQNLPGFAKWMLIQSEEERKHALKFFQFLVDSDYEVTLLGIDMPKISVKSPIDAFREALKQERHVTAKIHRLYELAHQEKAYSIVPLLSWFIDEQVEEEKSALDAIAKLEMFGGGHGLYLLDEEFGKRNS